MEGPHTPNNNQNKNEQSSFILDMDNIDLLMRKMQENNKISRYFVDPLKNTKGKMFLCTVWIKTKIRPSRRDQKANLINRHSETNKTFLISELETVQNDAVIVTKSSTPKSIEKQISDILLGKNETEDRKSEPIEKGARNERKIFEILSFLQKSGILTFKEATLEEDLKAKRDFLIEYKSFVIPLQVKSSKAGQEKHEHNDYGVPSIAVEDKTEKILTEQIIQILEAYTTTGEILHL